MGFWGYSGRLRFSKQSGGKNKRNWDGGGVVNRRVWEAKNVPQGISHVWDQTGAWGKIEETWELFESDWGRNLLGFLWSWAEQRPRMKTQQPTWHDRLLSFSKCVVVSQKQLSTGSKRFLHEKGRGKFDHMKKNYLLIKKEKKTDEKFRNKNTEWGSTE